MSGRPWPGQAASGFAGAAAAGAGAHILRALAILRAAGWADCAGLTVRFNSDEESGSAGSGGTIATLARA